MKDNRIVQISVVIPTLQKNIEILNNLVNILDTDDCVEEIIVIDNSLNGYSHDSNKIRVIKPEENLFVNPSWNLGVKESKNDIVALLNDDIVIPYNFCKSIVQQMNEQMGIVGFNHYYVENIPQITSEPKKSEIFLEKATGRCTFFGIAMFFYKTSYFEIPKDMKIYCGDDWLFFQNERYKKENYFISGQIIYHYGSLSSAEKVFNSCLKRDVKLYRKYTRKWLQHIFDIKPVFRGFRLTLFGFNIVHHFDKKH